MSWAGYGQGGAYGSGGGYGAPAGYGAQGTPSYGAPQGAPGYGAPQGAPRGYGAPQGAPGGYGAPQGGQGGYGAPQGGQRGYGAPQGAPGGYGAPQGAPGGYGAPQGYGGGFGGGFGGQAPPPPGVSPELWMWFQAVDADRSGEITASELAQALMNGNWTPFNAETCRLMIGMFDKDKTGTINVQEFAALWKYIQDWKACFDRFDTDRSGNIDSGELQNAFSTFGYRLSPQFCQMCVRVFDRRHTQTMNFDDFIQCCVMLKSLTDQFREKDKSQSGIVDIGYEDFLKMVLDNSII